LEGFGSVAQAMLRASSGYCVRNYCPEYPQINQSSGCPSGKFELKREGKFGYHCENKMLVCASAVSPTKIDPHVILQSVFAKGV